MELSLDEIADAYKYAFAGRNGEIVLDDLRKICGVDEPLCSDPIPTDRELLHRAAWHDVYKYIESMTESGDKE